jgi:Zn-dependent protease with chaperone function
MNGLKTMMLMVTLTLMLVFVGGFLGGKTGMTFALVMAFGFSFATYKLFSTHPPMEEGVARLLSMRSGV